MKILKIPAVGSLFLASVVTLEAAPKTANPEKVPQALLGAEPYRFNGVVTTTVARGSGFCAWNRRTFFSAAHVVFDDESLTWQDPPKWYPQAHSEKLSAKKAIRSRGFFRWTDYAQIAEEQQTITDKAFGRDFIVGFAFKDLIKGTPAKLNLSGIADLRKPIRSMITGYPAENSYLAEDISGYFMHRTGPTMNVYKPFWGNALQTTLITTGPGNSGGPIWTKNTANGWSAAGVLVGGMPSETIVYAFSPVVNTMLAAVSPVVAPGLPQSTRVNGVSETSRFFSSNRVVKLPDGLHRWTNYPLPVSGFGKDEKTKSVKISLNVKTAHRGDLQIVLTAPGGYEALIHNEEGADGRNLVISRMDVSEQFSGIEPEGRWFLRFQDRLKGDICTVQSAVLEVATAPSGGSTEEPEP
jgi:hypothetical protein